MYSIKIKLQTKYQWFLSWPWFLIIFSTYFSPGWSDRGKRKIRMCLDTYVHLSSLFPTRPPGWRVLWTFSLPNLWYWVWNPLLLLQRLAGDRSGPEPGWSSNLLPSKPQVLRSYDMTEIICQAMMGRNGLPWPLTSGECGVQVTSFTCFLSLCVPDLKPSFVLYSSIFSSPSFSQLLFYSAHI